MNRNTRRAVCFVTTHKLTIFHNLRVGQGKQQARLRFSQVQKSKALKLTRCWDYLHMNVACVYERGLQTPAAERCCICINCHMAIDWSLHLWGPCEGL